ncbi:hypothetical protein ACVII1_000616 [Bradyrhizobium elkanii]
MATSASGRSDCAPACRTTLTNGNGNAASIKAAIGRPAAPASTFDDVRAGFEAAWGELLPTLAEADFQARSSRLDRAQAGMWDRGEKLPSQQSSSLMRCPCGATFDSHRPAESQIHTPHIYGAQIDDEDEGRPALGGPGERLPELAPQIRTVA